MSFDKYHLMKDEEYQRLRQKQVQQYNPELRIMARIDDDIKELLSDTTIPADVKSSIFSQLQQRFKDVKDASKVMPKEAISTEIEQPDVEPEPIAAAAVEEYELPPPPTPARPAPIKKFSDDILSGVDKNKLGKAKELLKLIKENPQIIATNTKGELVLHGKVIPRSNTSDLFRSLYSHYAPTSSPEGAVGHSKFIGALREINVPLSLISSKIQSAKLVALNKPQSPHSPNPKEYLDPVGEQSPLSNRKPVAMKGKGLPPGKRIRMLTVYRK